MCSGYYKYVLPWKAPSAKKLYHGTVQIPHIMKGTEIGENYEKHISNQFFKQKSYR